MQFRHFFDFFDTFCRIQREISHVISTSLIVETFVRETFRDFANFCCFLERLSREIAIHLQFAKVYLAKFCAILYSLKFDQNFVFFCAKTALFAATLHSLAKVYLGNFAIFSPRESSLAKVSMIKVLSYTRLKVFYTVFQELSNDISQFLSKRIWNFQIFKP